MSRTKRKSEKDTEKRHGDMFFMGGTLIEGKSEVTWKDYADKKKNHKPGKKAKTYLHKGQKAKLKQELATADDFDDLPMPRQPHTDIWNYN